jgi:ribosomal protein S18 acetylase RimI-like enzyme
MEKDIVKIELRRARQEDREKVIAVESGATPNLSYLAKVFDMFLSEKSSAFIVAEVDGKLVGCGKFTKMPDGSAWLEALRVLPEFQGIGIGKCFYQQFFDIARHRDVTTMRMYTGVKNAVSKGLAEQFGFNISAAYRGAWLPCPPEADRGSTDTFRQVTDPDRATAILMPFFEKWTGFLVMNRTFFALNPALCRDLAQKGCVYEDPKSRSVITLGARFMPEQALHIGVFGGDSEACLGFAAKKGAITRTERLSCLFPPSAVDLQDILTQNGFRFEASDFIVMTVHC